MGGEAAHAPGRSRHDAAAASSVVGSIWGEAAGLAAAVAYLISPAGFLFSRVEPDRRDAVVLLHAHALSRAGGPACGAPGRPAAALAALAGLAAGGAFLAKGLIALVLPGSDPLCLVSLDAPARGASLARPLPRRCPSFSLVCLPWLWPSSRACPGFCSSSSSTSISSGSRPRSAAAGADLLLRRRLRRGISAGPAIFAGGPPGAGPIARWRDEHPDASSSLSGLPSSSSFSPSRSRSCRPICSRRFPPRRPWPDGEPGRARDRGPWLTNALFWPRSSSPGGRGAGLAPVIAVTACCPSSSGGGLLLAGAFAGVSSCRGSGPGPAALAPPRGWAAFFAAVALSWPKVPPATAEVGLARAAARRGEGVRGAHRRLPHVLQRVLLGAQETDPGRPTYKGELEPELEDDAPVRKDLFWAKAGSGTMGPRPCRSSSSSAAREGSTSITPSPAARILAEETKHMVDQKLLSKPGPSGMKAVKSQRRKLRTQKAARAVALSSARPSAVSCASVPSEPRGCSRGRSAQ